MKKDFGEYKPMFAVKGKMQINPITVELDRYQLAQALFTFALDALELDPDIYYNVQGTVILVMDSGAVRVMYNRGNEDVIISEHPNLKKAASLVNAANTLLDLQ